MWIRGSLIFIYLCLLCSCGTTQSGFRGARIELPESPAPVVIDNGQWDKAKYPNTKWVKPPIVDLKKRTGTWLFEDIDKISGSLGEWTRWEKDVKELIEGYNKLTDRKEDKTKR